MKSPLLIAAAKFVLYPLFYFVVLFGSIYATFPWERVKDRVEAEFAKTQAGKGSEAWRLEVSSLDGYWLTGVELRDAKIVIPPDTEDDRSSSKVASAPKGALASIARKAADQKANEAEQKSATAKDDAKDEKKAKEKKPHESIVVIDHAHARVRILPLLIGRVRVDFGADVFGGEVHGTVPVGG
ncbi:MAG TPA: hypothetical protein VL400_17600, partial [Polyangiaceae bacterium]|nr:hypothetical protein [Polyangiaceae bacterium]